MTKQAYTIALQTARMIKRGRITDPQSLKISADFLAYIAEQYPAVYRHIFADAV